MKRRNAEMLKRRKRFCEAQSVEPRPIFKGVGGISAFQRFGVSAFRRFGVAIPLCWSIVVTAGSPDEIPVVVRTIDEGAVNGGLVRFSISQGVVLRVDALAEKRIPTRDMVRISASVPTMERRPTEKVLTLSGGDTLFGQILKTDGDFVLVETVDLGTVPIPLEGISDILTSRGSQPAYQQSGEWVSRSQSQREDRVLLTNGDVLRGFITALDAEELALDTEGSELKLPFRLIVAVRFAAAKPASLPATFLTVFLASGSRLTVTDLLWSTGGVEARLRVGTSAHFPSDRIVRVDVLGGRWEWLSEHTPISFLHTPMLSLDWPFLKDRNVRGRPLRVADEEFERGIGVHSRSRLTFELQGEYREFVTSFGLDDDSGPLADVAVLVLVDGRTQFEQRNIRRGKRHGPIRIDIRHASRIELICDFGDNGDLQDRFNWIEPALIRE